MFACLCVILKKLEIIWTNKVIKKICDKNTCVYKDIMQMMEGNVKSEINIGNRIFF